MNHEWVKLRRMHGLISGLLASLGAVGVAWASFWGSVRYFAYEYPHDGMDGLGALFVGISALPVSWVVLFMMLMKWLHVRAWRRQEAKRMEAAKAHFTITKRQA